MEYFILYPKLFHLSTNSDKFTQIQIQLTHNTTKYKLLEQDDSFRFSTIDKGNEDYVSIEFANNKLFITNFSIKVSPQKYSPKNWKVEGFNGEEWVLIKQLTNIYLCGGEILNCTGAFGTFEADKNGPFTRIKFTANGFRTENQHYGHIQINSLELFGILRPVYFCSTYSRYKINTHLIMIDLFAIK